MTVVWIVLIAVFVGLGIWQWLNPAYGLSGMYLNWKFPVQWAEYVDLSDVEV